MNKRSLADGLEIGIWLGLVAAGYPTLGSFGLILWGVRGRLDVWRVSLGAEPLSWSIEISTLLKCGIPVFVWGPVGVALTLLTVSFWELLGRAIYAWRFQQWFKIEPLQRERQTERWVRRRAFFSDRLGYRSGHERWARALRDSGGSVHRGVRCDLPPVLEKMQRAYRQSAESPDRGLRWSDSRESPASEHALRRPRIRQELFGESLDPRGWPRGARIRQSE